jgi:hypothetical protein
MKNGITADNRALQTIARDLQELAERECGYSGFPRNISLRISAKLEATLAYTVSIRRTIDMGEGIAYPPKIEDF